MGLYSCILSWKTQITRKKHTKQNKKRPQAELSTGQLSIPLAITLIFPPSCDHAFWHRASSPDKYMSVASTVWLKKDWRASSRYSKAQCVWHNSARDREIHLCYFVPQSPKAECRAAGDTQVISQNGIGVVLAKRHVLKFNVFINIWWCRRWISKAGVPAMSLSG